MKIFEIHRNCLYDLASLAKQKSKINSISRLQGFDITEAETIWPKALELRETEKTKNNTHSSRSHAGIIFVSDIQSVPLFMLENRSNDHYTGFHLFDYIYRQSLRELC